MEIKKMIELDCINKSYGTNEAKNQVINNISLQIKRKTISVILGSSGSGKSTLLNLIGGLDSVDSGRIIVDQEEISQLSKKGLLEYRRSKLSYIFQFYNLIPNLNVKENIRVCQYLSDNPLNLEELVIFLGIEDQQFKFPSQLSGGQQQRVAIARALVKNPQLLLCDEPTGALDSVSALETLKLLQQVNQDYETTILLVTHNEEIAKMADNIIRVKDGKVVEMIENKHKQDASLLVV